MSGDIGSVKAVIRIIQVLAERGRAKPWTHPIPAKNVTSTKTPGQAGRHNQIT